MAKYRKNPGVIDAIQYPCEHPALKTCGCVEYVASRQGENIWLACSDCGHHFIDTLEGRKHVSHGDWIITDGNGEHYPCKPEIFDKTYELVEE